MKTLSPLWSCLVGLLTVLYQVVTFYVRFGRWNTDASITDYVSFFLAGALGGWILVFFLNRQATSARRWVVLIAFLLASPVAMFMMLGGGLLGPLGTLIFPQVPWALFSWLGSLAGRLVLRK